MSVEKRLEAAWAIVRALRTGEITAARVAIAHLATVPSFTTPKAQFDGLDQVGERLTGLWSYTPVLAAGAWDVRETDAGTLTAFADFSGLGAAPADLRLVLSFDADDCVVGIVEHHGAPTAPSPLPGMTPWIRRCIDRALAEAKPVTVAYVTPDGLPSQSLRGSLYTHDARTLGLWLRKAEGGLADVCAAGRPVSFLYRDSATRTTLTGRATPRLIHDQALRRRIFDATPEVEQLHEPARTGSAALLDLIELKGTSPHGPVLVRPG
jgi:hypothetical protein